MSVCSQEALSRLHGQSDQTDDTSSQSNWILDVDSRSFNLAVLGRTNENALTLRSDFMVRSPPVVTVCLLVCCCCLLESHEWFWFV